MVAGSWKMWPARWWRGLLESLSAGTGRVNRPEPAGGEVGSVAVSFNVAPSESVMVPSGANVMIDSDGVWRVRVERLASSAKLIVSAT